FQNSEEETKRSSVPFKIARKKPGEARRSSVPFKIVGKKPGEALTLSKHQGRNPEKLCPLQNIREEARRSSVPFKIVGKKPRKALSLSKYQGRSQEKLCPFQNSRETRRSPGKLKVPAYKNSILGNFPLETLVVALKNMDFFSEMLAFLKFRHYAFRSSTGYLCTCPVGSAGIWRWKISVGTGGPMDNPPDVLRPAL
ncbi:MAG: hypothetical protein LBH73_02765, partial [Spirochaetaceae bacterium]|nr:hypothetical protein [Spirochaetaceae bacterium]